MKNPLKLNGLWRRLDSLAEALAESQKHPPIGVTQGGSSRKYPGAKPAATVGVQRSTTNGEATPNAKT